MRYHRLLPGSVALLLVMVIFLAHLAHARGAAHDLKTIDADDRRIQYTGRIDFTDPKAPKFWAPGVTIQARFRGTTCDALIRDQVLWGKSHNYIEIVVDDGIPQRVQTIGAMNTIRVAAGLPNGPHTVTLCKDTEAGIGYLQFMGFQCDGDLLSPPRRPSRTLEFIGDSITCGAGSDLSDVPCGKRDWYDQHNAYMSYGPTTARALHAEWHVSSVSGIGMAHSCCSMAVTMPDVFGTLDFSAHGTAWDFSRYQPDAVTICLGQNDGAQDPATFDDTYVKFIQQVRSDYPHAQIICLTSPMADPGLTDYLKTNLTAIVDRVNRAGDPNVHTFSFSRSYNAGCGGHPDMAQHQLIAGELARYLSDTLHW
jgi:lysophospholipase L1-like esterase